jgi:DNA-binding LacI/PurR family transcriptional regulator
MRTTSRDVAELAGVSQATVSYVLNRTPGQKIPEETRQRVLAAAKELRYTPHASARTLRSGTSRLALLVVPEMAFGANIAVIIAQMTQGMSELGMSLATWQRTGLVDLATTLSNLQPQVVIGLLGLTDGEQDLLRDLGVPYVDVSRPPTLGDQARLQVEHLAERGHRRLVIVTSDHPLLTIFAGPRLAVARRTCAALGLPEPRVVTLHEPDERARDLLVAEMRAWHEDDDPPTGVVAFNDIFAAACLAAADAVGLDVPDDLAVVGIDDLPMARFTVPALTSVALDLGATARQNIELVQLALAGKPFEHLMSGVPVSLVVRQST